MAKRKISTHPEIVKMFDSLSGTRGAWEVWNDIITMHAICISNSLDTGERRSQREKLYLTIVRKYNAGEIETIMKIFGSIVNAFDNNPNQDLLGDLYMSMDFGSNALGQFFTPYHLCQLMTSVSVEKDHFAQQLEDEGFVTVNEPACGAGANIIALVNEVKKLGFNYQETVFVIAQDLSQVTALMCYIQLSLLGVAAAIYIGDTLQEKFDVSVSTLEQSENVWLTPMFYSDIWQCRKTQKRLKEEE